MGTLARRPLDKVASRLACALGTPAANTPLGLVPDRSWLYWRWGRGRQTVNRHHGREAAPKSPGGTRSRAVHRDGRGVGGTRWGGGHRTSRERQRGLCKRSRSPGRQMTLMNFLVLLLVNPG